MEILLLVVFILFIFAILFFNVFVGIFRLIHNFILNFLEAIGIHPNIAYIVAAGVVLYLLFKFLF